MKKKSSISSKIAFSFTPLHFIFGVCVLLYFSVVAYNGLAKRDRALASLLQVVSKESLQPSNIIELGLAFNKAIDDGLVDFFILRKNGIILVAGNAAGPDDNIHFIEESTTESFRFPSYELHTVQNGQYHLDIGYKRSYMAFLRGYFQGQVVSIIFQLAMVALIVFGVSRRNISSLINVSRRFLTKGQSRGDRTQGESKESSIILKGIRGYEEKISSLSAEHSLLKNQVLPSLRKEMALGKEPPYSFACTLVRTDINNFTSICDTYGLEHFTIVINEFFDGVSHIVSRYNGLIHEFIGDEVIFYFKDEDCESSAATAITALRDINRLADRIHEKTTGTFNYPFRIKSSLSYGTMFFGKRVDGFGISGEPFIESKRILSLISEKEENTVLYPEAVKKKIELIVRDRFWKTVELTGMSEPRVLYSYLSHPPISWLLMARNVESFARLSVYRSDDDIRTIFRFLHDQYAVVPIDLTLQLLAQLKAFKVTQDDQDVQDSYLQLVGKLQELASTDAGETARVLSSALMLAPCLFSVDAFRTRAKPVFIACLEVDDRRVIANVVEVFSQLDTGATDRVFQQLIERTDNRIAANALVKEGRSQWSRKVARRIRAMLKNSDPLFNASALYAIGEIALYLRHEDHASYHANDELQTFIRRAEVLSTNSNQLVRRQAMRTLFKAGNSAALTRLANETGVDVTKEIRDEIAQVLADKSLSEQTRQRIAA